MGHDITILDVPPFSSLCNLAFSLRREVFVREQQVPEEEEFDEHDISATHIVAIAEGEVVGTLRLVSAVEHVKIGRVAVRKSARGRGIARAMLAYGMESARRRGWEKFHLAAQLDKLAFYERLGFVAYGEVFDDAGIPHKSMRNHGD
ncbi:GNAT family N-acetyltransferase [Halovulum sp. GXIMD14794]